MKKIVIALLVIIVVLFTIILSVPVIFKGSILEKSKIAINNRINATIGFSDFRLSLIRSFPDASIELKDFYIAGTESFSKDTLLKISSLRTDAALFSLFGSKGIKIKKIAIENPVLHLKVNKDSIANWNILKSEKPSSTNNISSDSKPIQIHLDKINISNADILYEDLSTKLLLCFFDTNMDMSGNLYGSSTRLNSTGNVDNFTLIYDSITYISGTNLDITSVLDIDYQSMIINLIDNELLVNQLPLDVFGNIKMPEDSILFDLEFASKTSGLENLLALIPPVYSEYLKDFETKGIATFNGFFKGKYFEDTYPALHIELNVDEGSLQYPSLPENIDQIRANLIIDKPQGSFGQTTIKVNEAHTEINHNPIDFELNINDLLGDINFEAFLKGTIDFDGLNNVLPLDNTELMGIVNANLETKGSYAAIKNSDYDKIISDGLVELYEFSYTNVNFTEKILIPEGILMFTPLYISLSQFDMAIGRSDFSLTGNISNYLEYLLNKGILTGNLQLRSDFVDLNQLMTLQRNDVDIPENNAPSQSENPGQTDEARAFNVPENIDLDFTSTIRIANINRIPISNINGLITLKNGKLNLEGLNMDVFEGELEFTGSYQNTPQNEPLFDFGFNIAGFNIPITFNSLSGMQQLIPIAGQSSGDFNSNLKIAGRLSEQLKFIPSTLNGYGNFNSRDVVINNSPLFQQLNSILNQNLLNHVTIDDFNANFNIEDGNIALNPFKTSISGQEATIYGNINADNLIDLKLDFMVKRNAFGNDIQEILKLFPGNENITEIPATVLIEGPVADPKIGLDLSETRRVIAEEAKNSTLDNLQESLERIGDGLRDLFGN